MVQTKSQRRVVALKQGELLDALQATFYFLCVDEQTLAPSRVPRLMSDIFLLIGRDAASRFDTYIAFIENLRDYSEPIDLGQQAPLPGRCEWVQLQTVTAVLAEKELHESEIYRQQGRVSTHAPPFLTEKTCVIVVGRRRFLLEHVDLYLERTGAMRRIHWRVVKDIADLHKSSAHKPQRHSFAMLEVKSGEFYHGNFNALVAQVRATSIGTKELLKRLGITEQA